MKVGIFTECYEPVNNGVVHSIQNTKRGLEELGHQVFIFTPDYGNDNKIDPYIVPCKSKAIPGGSGYHFVFDFDDRIKQMILRLDIIHTHQPFTMARHLLKFFEKNPKPLIFTHHTQYDQYAHLALIFEHQAKQILTHYLKSFCDRCDTIIAPSKSIQDTIENYGTQTPVHVVLNSIDLKYFNKQKLEKPKIFSKLNPKYKKIVLATRVEKEKNIKFLIRAFRVIFLTHAPAYLIIIGGGKSLEYLKNLTKNLELENNILFTGAVSYEEVRKYLHFADFFTTASKTEVLPLGLIEAQAASLPIVAIDAIGTRDIVENNKTGYLTKDNIRDFAVKIIELINSPGKVKKMSKAALNASKKYSIKICATEMTKAYKEAMKLHKLKHGTPLTEISKRIRV